MEIIPSIDILDNRVVQLVQGDYNAPRDFQMTPIQAAHQWTSAGAKRIHIVNLSGAESGRTIDQDLLAALVAEVRIPIQMSGDVRDCETAFRLVNVGIDRVVFGMAAVTPEVVRDAVQQLGSDRVVVGLHATNGVVATHGRTQTMNLTAADLIERMRDLGVVQFMYTDIDRVGTMQGPNLDTLADFNRRTNAHLTVAGGIGDISHLRSLASIGIESVVLGTSIYTGAIDFRSAREEFE